MAIFQKGMIDDRFSFVKSIQLQLNIYLLCNRMSSQSNSVLISRLLDNLANAKLSESDIWPLNYKIIQEIREGGTVLPARSQNIADHINHQAKADALKKIFYSSNYYIYERDQKLMLGLPLSPSQSRKKNRKQSLREEEIQLKKKQQEDIRREFLQKMKRWQQQKIQIAKRKRKAEMKKQMLENNSEEKRKREEKQIQAFLKLEKKKIIEARIIEIERRKDKRAEQLQQSSVKRSNSLPRYVEYENRYKSIQLQKSIEKKILMENRKASLEMDIEKIKEHQKAYINRIKERLNMKSHKVLKSEHSRSREEEFKVNKKDQNQMKKVQEKIKRIKKFESKLRLLPLKIDNEKKRQKQIMHDKLKNPKKYHFLSQKALSDQQIFDNFKDFDINIDFKDIGNNYLDEVIMKNRRLKRKFTSHEILPVHKPQYKNYLQQMRQKKKSIQNPDEFDIYAKKLKGNNAYREHGKRFLQEKSELYQKKAINNIIQLQQLQRYPQSIRKQQQIDDNYAKALKAKIALAKLN